jgi:bifunctional ADP-heptose synthase (sugar kinase/adenylyltransferase)
MSKDTPQQKQYKILLIGEVCQDVYVFGEVDRISPEAPVPIIKKSRKEFKEGMSGNVANNLLSILPGVSLTKCQNDMRSLKKIRFIDKKTNYQLMRYDIEKPLQKLKIKDIPEEDYDAIVISDYAKGFVDHETIGKIINKFPNTKMFADTKKKNLGSFGNAIIKLNESEYLESHSHPHSSEVIVTLGDRGCTYKGKVYSTKKVDMHDVCGAGDVFLATLVARWLETKDMVLAIKTANNCAALSVTKLGCYTLTREEYQKSIV